MFIAVARLVLQIPESGSLKAKRQVVRRVTDRLKARFNVAVAEVADNDLWQKATLGLAVVGNERRHVDEQLEKIIRAVEEMYVAPLLSRETEIMGLGDRLFSTAHVRSLAEAEADAEEDEEEPEGEEAEGVVVDASFDLAAHLARGERSLAEAEGMQQWEERPREPQTRGAGPGERGDGLSLEEARARARALRKPRDWEKS